MSWKDENNLWKLYMKNVFKLANWHTFFPSMRPPLWFTALLDQIIRPEPQEHLFVVKSVMKLYENLDKPLLISMYDIRSFFDAENLTDVLSEAYSCKVKGKIYRFILWQGHWDSCVTPSTINHSFTDLQLGKMYW